MKKPTRTRKPHVRLLRVDQLLTHPRNIRQLYLQEEVEQMAQSIRACKGVIQALRVVPAWSADRRARGKRGKYYVVAGNKRLAGARLLGKRCPLLKCEIVNESEARQLLDMVVENFVRSRPDPISEALHYRSLIKDEGYTPEKIAAKTGVPLATIQNRLLLLKLEPEIQDLIAQGRLPRDRRAAEALMKLPKGKGRIRLAQRLAELDTPIRGIVVACQKFLETSSRRKARPLPPSAKESRLKTPSLELAQENGHQPSADAVVGWPALREAARNMCLACDIKAEMLGDDVPEPAWSLITHAAEETCQACPLPKLTSTCRGCPGVEIIRRLIAGTKAAREAQNVRYPSTGSGRSLTPVK
jgi:ParB family chromosome partitioning protein